MLNSPRVSAALEEIARPQKQRHELNDGGNVSRHEHKLALHDKRGERLLQRPVVNWDVSISLFVANAYELTMVEKGNVAFSSLQ